MTFADLPRHAWYTLTGADLLERAAQPAPTAVSTPTPSLDAAGSSAPNELTERDQKSLWAMVWEQVSNTLVVMLIVAAVGSAFLGDYKDAIAILAIVVLNTCWVSSTNGAPSAPWPC